MKIHQLARDLISWDQLDPPSLSCNKRLRPLAPKLLTTFDLKTFVRPRSTNNNDPSPHLKPQVETHPGGTRWNPTQEQIEILETLYRGGMRTPNAQQIEHITERLSEHGKIEGKNVFYWFQNHKARERQKLKRSNGTTLGLTHSPRTSSVSSLTTVTTPDTTKSEQGQQEESVYKRRCRSWTLQEESTKLWSWSCKDEEGDRTLELFPLHPEGRS